MSGELADTPIEETRIRTRRRLVLSDPAVSFVTSSAVWVLLLVGTARFPYDLSTVEAAIRDPRVVASFGVAMFALLVAIVAGLVYVVDHRRRRSFHPRGYRAPQKTRFTVIEAFGGLLLFAYMVIVVASAAALGMMLVVDGRGADLRAPSPEEASLLAAIVIVYCYHLFVFPASGFTFLVSRRYQRGYPDESTREGHGFDRSARTLLAANAITIVALVAVELIVVSGQLPG